MAEVISMPKDMDAAEIDRMRDTLDSLANKKTDVTLDLAETTFIDSSGIGAIVFLFKRLSMAGCELKLVHVSGQPLRLLKHLKLTNRITVEGDAAA
ncbi:MULTISPECIES: STAS domain-containing protein [Pseudovibrio]|uniref:STAS domain-containing protein n=1 Tax=Stappiaceae TaxID=2821832 RepID=UPI0023673939|nr:MULTISPECIES: STAS domain-containing protein [Pseudovibrio]MDD7909228.1 STAS domain-containing protein [Pseudovibrio exalbescens]MDX5595225.1 STAS domain-containing protein [Pseudovibrio sp. SPO723]